MQALRTRFKKNIVAEFLPPAAVLRGKKEKKPKVIILCKGMPSTPSFGHVIEFFSKKGFWVFAPRYRGTWESGGEFLEVSPDKDVRDIISELSKGFKDIWVGKKYRVHPSAIYLLGSSFGGPAVILNSKDPRVTKVIALSPVVDFTAISKTEPIHKLERFTREAFGDAYRPVKNAYRKLESGKFYNPAASMSSIRPEKIFIIHAENDKIVPVPSVKKFIKQSGSKFLLLKKGGHFSLRNVTEPRFWKRINAFIKS